MSQQKKFKQRVRALAEAENLSYMEAHRRLSRVEFYRSLLLITDSDGYEIDRKVINLSSFPRRDDLVGLRDGRKVAVWHPILKATKNPMSGDAEDYYRPCVLASPVETHRRPTVREIVAAAHAQPVPTDLFPDTCPGGVRRFLTRPLADGDGVDVELGTSLVGHHVTFGPGGFHLQRGMLDVEHGPRFRYRLPQLPTAA